ncbi:DUF4199 domain-containing protein [Tenacibaculum sp. S7007]|uniref:DUF4199 domain-containing protein n=1 Tax=Tenacibaculum pelagium TaxID=2759527 RepID=A0A839ALV4_9FLAO|nr:DUF4199 domain-containing protein [Tenacibaculum pelagium]MBA6155149.1 DUF4199 domain-containing protein [Tenacibaculum pelagium]
MENQTNSKSIILNYGLLTGGVAILLGLVAYAMGNTYNPGVILSILTYLVPIVLIVLGIKKFKQNNNDYLAWGQAVKIGVGIALIWGLLAVIFGYLLENVIDPNLIEQKMIVLREGFEKWGLDEDMIEQQLEAQQNTNPLLASSMALLFFAFIGFVVSAIAGAIMKKTEENDY